MRSAILIHGRHVDTDGFEEIIWGDPRNGVFGNASRGVELAIKENAELIFWGTGSSVKNGVVESQLIFDYAVEHGNELSVFKDKDEAEVKAILAPKSFIDLETQNTAEEVKKAVEVCIERGIERLILVSAPTHIARCLMVAEKLKQNKEVGNVEIFATASDVSYKNSNPSDVVVIEPPHRGDAPKWQTYQYARALFEIQKQGNDTFRKYHEEWGTLLKKFGITVSWPPET